MKTSLLMVLLVSVCASVRGQGLVVTNGTAVSVWWEWWVPATDEGSTERMEIIPGNWETCYYSKCPTPVWIGLFRGEDGVELFWQGYVMAGEDSLFTWNGQTMVPSDIASPIGAEVRFVPLEFVQGFILGLVFFGPVVAWQWYRRAMTDVVS